MKSITTPLLFAIFLVVLIALSAFVSRNDKYIVNINPKKGPQLNIDGRPGAKSSEYAGKPSKSGFYYTDTVSEFEMTIDLKNQLFWKLSSVPQKQTGAGMFPEASQSAGLATGYNRALLSWFIIDPLFYNETGNLRPPNVDLNELSKNTVRQVLETEVFPNKEIPNGIPKNMPVLNLTYYPSERGPYNFDVEGVLGISAGIDADGKLKNPETRWAGIMRKFDVTDFEAVNMQFIEFWLMDPFANGQTTGGDLYLNIGDISEDVLMDSKMFYENGVPSPEMPQYVDTTIWGKVPFLPASTFNFSNIMGAREYQDVGFDGLRDVDELSFFDENYLHKIEQLYGTNSLAYTNAISDLSNDNYHYFRGSDYDEDSTYSSIIERYKRFCATQGNSPTDAQNPEPYPTAHTYMPDFEDVNRDNILSEDENYYQYKITLDPNNMLEGANYISDVFHAQGIRLPNGQVSDVKWYRFRIPVNDYSSIVGNIDGFQSIRFMRIFLKNFYEPTVLRFATLNLVRIADNPDVIEVNVFPNPATKYLNVDFAQPVLKEIDISLVDYMGRTVYANSYPPEIYHKIRIDVSVFEPGIYFLIFKTRTFEFVEKVVVM